MVLVVGVSVLVLDLLMSVDMRMALDHEQLTFRHAGRDFRLTEVSGGVVRPILS